VRRDKAVKVENGSDVSGLRDPSGRWVCYYQATFLKTRLPDTTVFPTTTHVQSPHLGTRPLKTVSFRLELFMRGILSGEQFSAEQTPIRRTKYISRAQSLVSQT